ncbi:MAG TPA: TRAP transporter substrate-binding protein [Burkholderiaceae bacterium]|jgi:TRAP-type transport system periplasmic protein|nr:TRAP transporter substrate-binding protein [Burkholderiaceae bacterium]
MLLRTLLGAATVAALTLPQAQAQTTLTMSVWVPHTHMLVREGFQPWTERVEKETNGRVKIRILPKGVAGAVQHFDAAKDGLTDIAFISHSYTPARFQMLRMAVLPFGGDNAESQSVALWRIHQKHFDKLNEHAGTHLLTLYTHGPGIFWNNKRATRTIDDFAGLKIRVGGGIAADVATALGANAIAKPAPESYELLSSGVVDGVMFPGESIKSFKLEKLVKFATDFPGGLYSDSHAVVINEAAWKRLSKQDQDAIMRVSGEALAREIGKTWDRNAAEGFELLKANGGELIRADANLVKAVAERTAKFEREWLETAKSRGIDGDKVIAEYRALVKQVDSERKK